MKSSLGNRASSQALPPSKERVLAPGPNATRAFAVLGVERVEDIHALDDATERRERLAVVGGRVVPEVDEDLRRPAVGDGERKGHRPADVRLPERFVRYRGRPPCLCDRRVAIDAELHPPACRDAEEPRLVVVSVAHEVDEPVGAKRRPLANDLDQHFAPRGVEPDDGARRRRLGEFRRGRVDEQRPVRLVGIGRSRVGGDCKAEERGENRDSHEHS